MSFKDNIKPNYYEFPFGVSAEDNVANNNSCFETCLNTEECVQYLFFKKEITLSGTYINKNTCYLRKTLNLQNSVVADPEIVEIGSFKSCILML